MMMKLCCSTTRFQSTLPYGSDGIKKQKRRSTLRYFNPRSLTGATLDYME